jgi:hypothetical protein
VIRLAVDRQFARLAGGPDGQLLTLNGAARPGLPCHFRVTVTEREKRCPALLLEAVEPPPAVGDPTTATEDLPPESLTTLAGRWQAQFLAEVAELLAGAPGDSATRSPLDFVLADLRALLRKDPRKFTLLLFAGYLYVGDALSLGHGESEDNRYARAAYALAQVAGTELPEGVLGPLLPAPTASANEPVAARREEAAGWLRRFFSLG